MREQKDKRELIPSIVAIRNCKNGYNEQASRTHLMLEYGKSRDATSRQTLVDDYFRLPQDEFAMTYPHLASEDVKRPLTQEDYDRMMLPLNAVQRAIVEAEHPAMVVIAGSGSGKTCTIVHRIAYLVKVKRISPDRILVLAYNRNAVHSLRQRLKELIGSLASSLREFTFHGLALALLCRILGTEQSNETRNFDQLLQDAIALLEQANDQEALDAQAQIVQLLGHTEYVFVDEYDDPRSVQINLCAIGDDDQNIYEFRGTSPRYFLNFRAEYKAEQRLLTENYRSSEPIIAAANALICHNQQRCKHTLEEQVQINSEWRGQGGKPVRALQFSNAASQAGWICQQIQSWLIENILIVIEN